MLNEEVGQFSAQLLKLVIMVMPLPLISSYRILTFRIWNSKEYIFEHGLRTPNEGINQRILEIWADVADKICFGRT
jgi:hypothetical protein